jgi:hypothetical protein
MRRAFIDPDLQTVVLIALLLGLTISAAGILSESPGLFRFGWAIWLIGVIGFITALGRLATEVRRMLRARPAA